MEPKLAAGTGSATGTTDRDGAMMRVDSRDTRHETRDATEIRPLRRRASRVTYMEVPNGSRVGTAAIHSRPVSRVTYFASRVTRHASRCSYHASRASGL
jgi:hypothetical protein